MDGDLSKRGNRRSPPDLPDYLIIQNELNLYWCTDFIENKVEALRKAWIESEGYIISTGPRAH